MYGNTALHYCITSYAHRDDILFKSTEAFKEILKKSDINVNLKNNEGYTILRQAVFYRNTDSFKMLLEFPDIVINSKTAKNDLLIVALEKDNSEVAEVLIQNPNLNVNGLGKKIPLFMSIHSGIHLFKLLLNHPKINVNIKDSDGDTILLYLLKILKNSYYSNKPHDQRIKLLLEHPKIDVNVENNNHENAFLIMYDNGFHSYPNEIYKLLISHPKFSIPKTLAIVNFIKKSFYKDKNVNSILQTLKQKNKQSLNVILDTIEE